MAKIELSGSEDAQYSAKQMIDEICKENAYNGGGGYGGHRGGGGYGGGGRDRGYGGGR